EAAVLLWDADAEQPELPGAVHQPPRELPVFRLELVDARQHFLLDEFFDGLRHQPMFVGHLLRREDRCRIRFLEQPGCAFSRARLCPHGPILPNIPAYPMPPPAHIVTSPYRDWPRRISCRIVVVSFAPVQPSGWPSAIAPPLTFSLSGSIGSSRRQASTWAANASFSSTRSMSSSERPVSLSTLRIAGTGPMPKRSGSTPAGVNGTNRAMGKKARPRASDADVMMTAAAPSLVCDELPAVTVPCVWNAGRSPESAVSDVSRRGPSSVLNSVSIVLGLPVE